MVMFWLKTADLEDENIESGIQIRNKSLVIVDNCIMFINEGRKSL